MKWSERLVVAKLSLACLLGTAMVIGGSSVFAAQDTFSSWSGAGGDGDWNNVANWSSGSLDIADGSVSPDDLVVPDSATATADAYIGGRIDRGDADPTNLWPASSAPHLSPPVIDAGAGVVVVNRFNINTGNDGFDGEEALVTVDGGRVDVTGGGSNAAVSIGRSVSKTLPAGSVPKSTLVIQNGGEFFVGNVLHPTINGGILPAPAAGVQVRLGQSNIVIDGPGSKLVVSAELRYVGNTNVGKNPLPGSGIVVSNGGYLEAGSLRLERLNGLDGLDLMVGVTPGSNAGFLDIVGPGSSVKIFNSVIGVNAGHTLLEKIEYMIDVDGVIVADGGAMAVGITDTGDGGYLLTSVPVPEPSSIVLLGMAFAGLAGCGARRRC